MKKEEEVKGQGRSADITLDEAKKLHKQGGLGKEIALRAYNEDDLYEIEFNEIKTFEDACRVVARRNSVKSINPKYAEETTFAAFTSQIEGLKAVNPKLCALYEIELVLEALNGNGWRSKIVFYDLWHPTIEKFYTPEFKVYHDDVNGQPDLTNCVGHYTDDDFKKYYVIQTTSFTRTNPFHVIEKNAISGTSTMPYLNSTLFACRTKEIAYHFGKYFAKQIFLAKFGIILTKAINI